MTIKEAVCVLLMGLYLFVYPPQALACNCVDYAVEALKNYL